MSLSPCVLIGEGEQIATGVLREPLLDRSDWSQRSTALHEDRRPRRCRDADEVAVVKDTDRGQPRYKPEPAAITTVGQGDLVHCDYAAREQGDKIRDGSRWPRIDETVHAGLGGGNRLDRRGDGGGAEAGESAGRAARNSGAGDVYRRRAVTVPEFTPNNTRSVRRRD